VSKSSPSVPTCVTSVSCRSVVSSGLGEYGQGDSGVTGESWVWRESIEDNGSRSGQLEDAWYIVSLFWIGPSRAQHVRVHCFIVEQHGGQFIVMQPDCHGNLQFNIILVLVWTLRDGE